MENSREPNDIQNVRPVVVKHRRGFASGDADPVAPLRHPVLYGILLLVLLILLTILAFAAVKWQQSSVSDPGSAATTGTAQSDHDLPASAYARQDRLLAGVNDRFEQLNPLYATGDGENDAVALVFESLFRIDTSGNAVGQLAKTWQYEPESQILTVVLRPDHTFRDGRVVAAADVVYTYSCLLSNAYDGPLKGRLDSLQQVVPGPDEQTVLFQFSELTDQPDLRLLTVGILKADYYPYLPDRIFELRDGNLHPEGSGSFYVKEHSENHVVLLLRPGYAGQIRTIEIRQVASDAKFRMLQEGQLDVVRNVWDARMQQRALSLPGYRFYPFATSAESYFLVNPRPQPHCLIQRPSQRLAVLLTVDGQALSTLQRLSLAELESCELTLYYFQGVDTHVLYDNRAQADQIAASLQTAGLTVTLKAVSWPELAGKAASYDYDLLLLPATANSRLPDQSVLLGSPVQPDASALITGYRQEVFIVCKRLDQLTVNPYGYPFAALAGSWTDRIENIRIRQSEETSLQEESP
jgi:ABC-type transport system substrate-binding protein